MSRIVKAARKHPWAFAAFVISSVIELTLAFLWLSTAPSDQMYEPALVFFGMLALIFLVVSGMPSREQIFEEKNEKIDADEIVKRLGGKLEELLNITRFQRRGLLPEVLTPIYSDLELVHREYLVELSAAQDRFAANPDSLEEVLTDLQRKRLLKEPERQKLIATCDRLIARKWRPEVKSFIESTRNYFCLPAPLSALADAIDRPREEIFSTIQSSTGYSYVVAVLKYVVEQSDDSAEMKVIVSMIFDETLDSLRKAWVKVSGDFAEIKADSV